MTKRDPQELYDFIQNHTGPDKTLWTIHNHQIRQYKDLRQITSSFSKSTFETSGVPLPCSTSQLGEQFRCSLLPAENQILALKSHFNGEHRFCHLDYSASFHFSRGYIYT